MTSVWQAATPGQGTLVGHVNQLLTTHAATFTYNGAVINTDPTLTGDATSLGAGMLAQQVVISDPVNLGSVLLALGAVGAGQDALVTLQADAAGQPSGTPLVGCVVPPEWLSVGVADGPSTYVVPLAYALSAGTYWIVIQPGCNLIGLADAFLQAVAGTDDIQWTQTTGTGGAVYSGGSWTDESYGFGVYLRDDTGTLLSTIADDAVANVSYYLPAKVTSYGYTEGSLTNVYEWVIRSLGISPNLLCRDDASFEVTVGTAVEVENATVAQTDAASLDGLYSLQVTATADGDAIAEVGPYAVNGGDAYSWVAAFLSASDSVSAVASVAWYDGDTYLSTSAGSTASVTPAGWVASNGTDTAPDTATLAFVEFACLSATGTDVFYVDGVGLFVGSAAIWSYPGVGIASARTISYVDGEMASVT